MNIIKQVVGIDISMDDFKARFGSIDTSQEEIITKAETFENNKSGFTKLLKWANSKNINSLSVIFVMEASGVYYEELAYFLHKKGHQVVVVLPNKIRNFAKSLEIKSKTDPIDAESITKFALQRKLNLWCPPEPYILRMKALCREYHQLVEMRTSIKNQKHARQHSYLQDKSQLKRKQDIIKCLEKQIKEILKQIMAEIRSHSEVFKKIKRIATIKGVGEITILTVLAETHFFEHVENINQLVSYSGLDIIFNESGKKKGKTTISKKGNKFIRAALFMPSMSAAKYNNKMKELFIRLVSRGKNKKAALIAVARKLLILIYTIWKNDVEFIQDYTRQSRSVLALATENVR